MIRSRNAALALAALSCACVGDDPIGVATSCTDETGTVAVTVGTGLQPVVDWRPACAMAFLSIDDGASDQWAIFTDETTWDDPTQANLIVPPVAYLWDSAHLYSVVRSARDAGLRCGV